MTIVVTGLGAVTALGKTARETWDRIARGERGLRELTLFDPGEVRTRVVAEVQDLARAPSSAVSRTSELALHAAREAIAHAGLDVRARRVGLVLGGTTAGMFETESVLATLLSTERAREGGVVDAAREDALLRMLSHPLSAPTDRLVLELGPFTRARSLSSACSSGANALAVGAMWLELGLVDAVVCGGADSLCRVTLSGFNALGALDPNGARPFDVRRRGLTLGEGAAMMVLERAEEAQRRDKRAVCTFLGFASRSEAHHITNPEATGAAPLRAMQAALFRAGLSASDVDYVNAHGTGTPLNDPMETKAVARLLGDRVDRVPVSSQKGMIGHTLAASGAIEAVITALAIEHGVVPPTGGLEEPDPECRLSHVLHATERRVRVAISSSFGFGGMDTALVLGAAGSDGRGIVSLRRPPRRSVVVTGIAAVTPAGIFVGEDVADLPLRGEGVGGPGEVVELPAGALDADRSRRFDRSSQLAAVATGHALAQAGLNESMRRDVGIVLGIAFGAVDGTAEFMRRLRDKGARMVRPAEFPTLVPSSPAGHVSIYHGLGGPAVVVADLAASGECAVAQACELVATGDVERVCAGGVEERSAIVEEVLSVVFGGGTARPDVVRREGGAVLVLANADAARVPGERVLARLGDIVVWNDSDDLPLELAPGSLAPPEGAVVVLGGMNARAEDIVAATSWRACARIVCAPACGAHEAAGGIAIAVAAAKVARGDVPAALFLGSARGWSYAGTVWRPDRDGGA